MKFNFEKAKNLEKKAILGISIITTSLFPSHAKGQEKVVSDNLNTMEISKGDTIKKENGSIIKFESARNDYIKYMEDPSYKKRLFKEMYGDKKITPEMQQKVDEEYDLRLKKIKNVEIKNLTNPRVNNEGVAESGRYIQEENLVETSDTSIYHELSHASDGDYTQFFGVGNKREEKGFSDKKESMIGTQDEMFKKFENSDVVKNGMAAVKRISLNLWNEIEGKYSKPKSPKFLMDGYNEDSTNMKTEEGRKFVKDLIISTKPEIILSWIDNPFLTQIHRLNNENDYKLYEEMQKQIDKKESEVYYFNANTEIKARINNLRLMAIKKYGYDLKTDFNINNYPELKKTKNYLQLINKSKFSNNQINKLSKYVAMDDTGVKNNNESMA